MSGILPKFIACLDTASGAELIDNVGGLVAHFATWLADPLAGARVAEAGHTVGDLGGALDRTLGSLIDT